MANLENLFAKASCEKLTENGDLAYDKVSLSDNLLNLLFLSEYYQKHLNEAKIGTTKRDKIFAQFMRDPRFGLGRRDLGRTLMNLSECSFSDIIRAGRFDDLFVGQRVNKKLADFLLNEVKNDNELAKKWMPRYSSKNLLLARQFAKLWGVNKQQYGKLIKSNTTENKLSRKTVDDINFEHVPSLALIKYYKRFKDKEDTKYRFMEYLAKVKKGDAKMNISTTTVYDIFKNREKIDADLFFEKLEKISGNWIPIVDTSGSMWDGNDSIGKALSIGHYLAKCSSYAPNKVISFSSHPQLIELGVTTPYRTLSKGNTTYDKEINSMYTGDCSNTDFGAVMNLLKGLTDMPEYLVVLSDMEFDYGSRQSKEELQQLWKANGYATKIVWWNFNSRATTAPEMDDMGNIYLSGYNPMLLKFLQAGFDGEKFLNVLLDEYEKSVGINQQDE